MLSVLGHEHEEDNQKGKHEDERAYHVLLHEKNNQKKKRKKEKATKRKIDK